MESFRIILVFKKDDYRFYSFDEEVRVFRNEISKNFLDGKPYDSMSDLLNNLEMYKEKHFIIDYSLETK